MEAMSSPSTRAPLLAPDFPTLWPGMLVGGSQEAKHLPFSDRGARYYYFARNAIWHAVKMLGIAGGEVLAPAYHHGVEVEALIDAGASVRFYRIDSRWQVDLEDVERKITPATRAIYLTHFAGFPGPVRGMKAICQARGLVLIEDCALALLSADGDLALGMTGDVSVFCLYKTLPVPDGGALLVHRDIAWTAEEAVRPSWSSTFSHTASSLLKNFELRTGALGAATRSQLRQMGKRAVQAGGVERVATGTQHFDRKHVKLGMSSLSRRIARAQDFDAIVKARRRNYLSLLSHLGEVSAPLFEQLPLGVCPLFYPLVVRQKERLLKRLRASGIEAVDLWRHFHPACPASEFPVVALLRRSILEIPCHQDLSEESVSRIAQVVRSAVVAEEIECRRQP
jgi:dTDP-4-amino-4,6-dideoxygalactose transaminase